MFIAELFENTDFKGYITEDAPQLVVLYPGRFQPFHLGHRDVFASLQGKFGRDHVWISTSNKVEQPKSPFNFTDKSILMHAAGIPSDRIIESSNPYKIPPQFDPAKIIFIVAVGAPDKERLKPDTYKKDGNPSYFKSFTNIKECETGDKHGYVVIANERNKSIKVGGTTFDVSHGTETRAVWNQIRNDPAKRNEFLMQMYGRNDPEIGRVLDKIEQTMSESVTEGFNSKQEVINHFVSQGKSEASGASAWERGWRGPTKKKKLSPFDPDYKPKTVDNTRYGEIDEHIVKVAGGYELKSKHGNKNLGKYPTKAGAEKRERQVQYFKHQGVTEDAAGVGVVKNGNDPRYSMATMGDQNDVDASTLGKEMKAYGLTGRKPPKKQ